MRNKLYLFFLSLLPIFISAQSNNYSFNRVADCPGAGYQPSTFTIGDSLYVISGIIGNADQPVKNMTQHVWLYNIATDTWTQKSDFPGLAVYGGGSFVLNGMGYLVNGWDSSGIDAASSDLWQYNPQTDTWVQKAYFPGTTRYCTASFALHNKGYVSMGFRPMNKELWQYDPVTDSWSRKADFPGAARQTPVSFVVNDVAYAGLGAVDIVGGVYLPSDFYKYDDLTDTWTQLGLYPGNPLVSYYTIVINNEAYVVCGSDQNSLNYHRSAQSPNVWKYVPATDTWSLWGLFPDTAISAGVAGSANGQGYLGLGDNNAVTYNLIHKFWRFGPGIGATNCSATINAGFINNATRNFVASGNFSSTAVLSWNFGDGYTGTGVSATHNYDSAGTYTVVLTVTDTANGGCSASETAVVTITGISTCSVTLSSTHLDSLYTLYANPTGATPYTYLWTTASGIPFSNTPDPLVNIPIGDTATYCLIITDSTGCTANACQQYTGVASPITCQTYLYIYPQGSIPGLYYAYIYHTGAAPAAYVWNFGDGILDSIPGDSLANHIYSNFGFYDVCLTIIDSANCTSTFCDTAFYAYKVGGGPMNQLQVVATAPAVTTGISNIKEQLLLSAYPNPANDRLNIVASSQIDYLSVYSMLGQKVKEQQVPVNNTIDINQLAAGVYFVDVHIGNSSGRIKFIKAD